jgi:hypothetical protein
MLRKKSFLLLTIQVYGLTGLVGPFCGRLNPDHIFISDSQVTSRPPPRRLAVLPLALLHLEMRSMGGGTLYHVDNV